MYERYGLRFHDGKNTITLMQISGGGRIRVSGGGRDWWTSPNITREWEVYADAEVGQTYGNLRLAQQVAINLTKGRPSQDGVRPIDDIGDKR